MINADVWLTNGGKKMSWLKRICFKETKNSMIYQFVEQMKKKEIKGDWTCQVKKAMEDLGPNFDDDKLMSM